jgi:hypothetical protein
LLRYDPVQNAHILQEVVLSHFSYASAFKPNRRLAIERNLLFLRWLQKAKLLKVLGCKVGLRFSVLRAAELQYYLDGKKAQVSNPKNSGAAAHPLRLG